MKNKDFLTHRCIVSQTHAASEITHSFNNIIHAAYKHICIQHIN